MNAILLHGTCDKEEYFSDQYPSLSNSHWIPWLQKQLLIANVPTATPEIPNAFYPDYRVWKKEFERFDVNKNSVLVGHSCGGGFLLRWLTENKLIIKKLVLVAPWLDPKRKKTKDFFEFMIDPKIQERAGEIHIFISKDDNEDIIISVKTIKGKFPDAIIHEFVDKGHFCFEEMKTEKFQELLNVILG